MEIWERDVIRKHQSSLLQDVICTSIFISHLQRRNILSTSDVKRIESRGNSGEYDQTFLLLQILETKTGGFGALVEALDDCKQSGAVLILLGEVEEYFPDQNAFNRYGIKQPLDDILSKGVLFEGGKVPLDQLLSKINKPLLENILGDDIDVNSYKMLVQSSEISFEVTTNTIPTQLPYYIERSLSSNTQIDPSIFDKLEPDIFLIEGIQLYQLTKLALGQKSKMANNGMDARTDTSYNQIHGITVRFILLEHQNHFEAIAKLSKSCVHWIRYNGLSYMHVKPSKRGGIQRIKRFIVNTGTSLLPVNEQHIKELKGLHSCPALIYDSPGMGKTNILTELARISKIQSPNNNVIFISLPEFVRLFRAEVTIDPKLVRDKLLDTLCRNKFGRKIQEMLLESDNHCVEFFLDAFDEVGRLDIDKAKTILSTAVNDMKNFRVYVTTRPHNANDLEDLFGVLGCKILPFQEENQISFFTRYWFEQYDVNISDDTTEFARTCLKKFNSTVPTKDRDIAGIPLQCKMLAELYSAEVTSGRLRVDPPHFMINSVYKMYKGYVDMRINTNCETASEREAMYYYHVVAAIGLLFPGKLAPTTQPPQPSNLYKVGIMEENPTYPDRPTFVHRTMAEFLVSRLQIGIPEFDTETTVMHFLIRDVFQVQKTFKFMKTFGKAFCHPALVRFFDISMQENGVYEHLKTDPISAYTENINMSWNGFYDLIKASIASSSINLFEFIAGLLMDARPCDDFGWRKNVIFQYSGFGLQQCELGDHCPSLKKFLWEMCLQYDELKTVVSLAAKLSSVEMVRLAGEFFHSATNRNIYQFNVLLKHSPIYFALRRGKFHMVEFFLQKYTEAGIRTCSPLHICLDRSYKNDNSIIKDKMQIVKLLLSEIPDLLNAINASLQIPPLLSHTAHPQLINCLIKDRADVFVKSPVGKNVAHLTAEYFNPTEYHALVELIVSTTSKNTKDNAVPSSASSKPKSVDEHDIGNLFSALDNDQRSALDHAICNFEVQSSTLEMLKSVGVNFEITDGSGSSLLHAAADGHRTVQYLRMLLEKQYCSANLQNNDGDTFLHVTSEYYDSNDFEEIVTFLVSMGHADVLQIRNGDMQLPIHSALEYIELTENTLDLFKSHGVDFNAVDSLGRSILMVAAYSKRSVGSLKTLIKMGVNVMTQNSDGDTIAHYLPDFYTNSKYHEMVEFLFSNQYSGLFSVVNSKNQSPILAAIGSLELLPETFSLFIGTSGNSGRSDIDAPEVDIDFNCVDEDGCSVLHYAVQRALSVPYLTHLIEIYNCSVYIQDKYGDTLLHIGAEYYSPEQYHEIVKFLIDTGRTDVFKTTNKLKKTPFHVAFTYLELLDETLDILTGKCPSDENILESYVDLNAVDANGESILFSAVWGKRSVHTIQHLVVLGADFAAKDDNNCNLLHIAAHEGCFEVVKYFLELGLDVNETDNDGDNALHNVVYAATTKAFEVVEYLMQNGADFNCVIKKGMTPLMYAQEKNIKDTRILNALSTHPLQ